MALLAVGVAKKEFSGRHLLLAASLWVVAVLEPARTTIFFLSLGSRNRTKIALVFSFGWL